MNKVYLLFEGECYYPNGGAFDFSGSFATLEGAQNAYGLDSKDRWAHVASFDGKELEMVSYFGRGSDGEKWRLFEKVKA